MIHLDVFVFLVLLKAQITLSVEESFGVDFPRSFNSNRCDNGNSWRLVTDEDLNVEFPFGYAGKELLSSTNSCTSLAPITLFGGALEFNVYFRTSSRKSALSVQVIDEVGNFVSIYLYGRFSEGFKSGWQMIYIPIKKIVEGEIEIRGRNLSNETILIESFRYIPDNTITNEYKRNKRIVNNENEYDTEMAFDYEEIKTKNEHSPSSSFWNVVTIFFLTFRIIVAMALVVVGIYCYCKIRDRDNILSTVVLEGDHESPRTVTIPRIAAAYEISPSAATFI